MITTQYDEQFKTTMKQWLPEWDWAWLKSQAYAESLLKADAVSPVGAKGILQFMDDTWSDVKFRLRFPFSASPFDPEYAIQAGAYYMSLMRNGWAAPRSEEDRRSLAQASYNAGFGNILHAQRLTTENGTKPAANDWAAISAKLSQVTGAANAKQTIDYVKRIAENYQQFKAEEGV